MAVRDIVAALLSAANRSIPTLTGRLTRTHIAQEQEEQIKLYTITEPRHNNVRAREDAGRLQFCSNFSTSLPKVSNPRTRAFILFTFIIHAVNKNDDDFFVV